MRARIIPSATADYLLSLSELTLVAFVTSEATLKVWDPDSRRIELNDRFDP
ncbi:MAG: hypothetical protein ACI8T1_003222 [Verrucomicrobiales bacterium]|jgi:hypothetical protein